MTSGDIRTNPKPENTISTPTSPATLGGVRPYTLNLQKKTHIHYINIDGLNAIVTKENGRFKYHYAYTDHLGSIVTVTDSNAKIEAEQSFDAWGKERNANTWDTNTPNTIKPKWLYRGYTGHESTFGLGLINMNGRMYDPVLARMLSPDNYIQSPLNSQNYNRYSYVLNNPLKYTDPDGELFILAQIAGLSKGIRDGIKGNNFPVDFVKGYVKGWQNSWKITGGLFVSDPNKNTGGRIGEVLSRLTWQLPQTLSGFIVGHGANTVGQVDHVEYFHGATVIDAQIKSGAFTLGSYILGPKGFRGTYKDHLFVHEYGHYLQSQRVGPRYIFDVGLPSVTSFWYDKRNNLALHRSRAFEVEANNYAAEYFSEHFSGFEVNAFTQPNVLSSYTNPRNQGNNNSSHPLTSTFHPTDVFFALDIYWLLLLP